MTLIAIVAAALVLKVLHSSWKRSRYEQAHVGSQWLTDHIYREGKRGLL